MEPMSRPLTPGERSLLLMRAGDPKPNGGMTAKARANDKKGAAVRARNDQRALLKSSGWADLGSSHDTWGCPCGQHRHRIVKSEDGLVSLMRKVEACRPVRGQQHTA